MASFATIDQTPMHFSLSETPMDSSPGFLRRPTMSNFSELNNDELFALVTLANKTLKERGAATTSPQANPKEPDIYDNAKFEQIACAGLQPKYDGTADKLIPILNLIHIRRQNEVWYCATFLQQEGQSIDLVRQFSKVTSATVLQRAQDLWGAAGAATQHHTRGSATYNARLLGVFLMNSLTNDFAALLHSRIDPAYSSDGPLLLHTMCTHIHRNHIAFVESVKGKIRLATLAEYKDDVPEFLRFLQDNLRLITSAGHDDEAHNNLIPHILLQLRNTKIPIFQQTILKWHRQYMENKLKLTSNKLVTMADEECQILKHSHQWVETIDPSIVAMQALVQTTSGQSNDILKSLAAKSQYLHTKR